MSEAVLDRILNKYDRRPSKNSQELQHTERKPERRDRDITFMDQQYTPNKESKNSQPAESQIVLKCLDETERKLAVSERNYGEVCRKYERAKQMCQQLSEELQKQRKTRLQQLIDLQNKLHLLQKDNVKSKTILEAKDHSMAVLQEKLKQKEEQTRLFQQQLEEISHKLHSTMQLKDQESINIIQKEISLNYEETGRSLALLKEKYEQQICELKKKVQQFDKILIEKERQKRGLLDDMEALTKNHQTQLKELRLALSKNEQTYREWLDNEKKEKIGLVQKYQQKFREVRRVGFMDKIKETEKETEQLGKGKIFVQDLEKEVHKLQEEIKNYKIQVATLVRADESSLNKVSQLQEELKQTKYQFVNQTKQTKELLEKLKRQEEVCKDVRSKYRQLESRMEEVKRKCEEVLAENGQLERENETLKQHMTRQLKSLVGVRKELTEATDSQLNINSTLTQAASKMKIRIKQLEEELELVTTDLYAERLEKAKIKQELQQSKIELKKEYELSMENTRKELEEKIKDSMKNKMENGVMDPEKQRLYLEMFKVERQYELLKSEVVTADQMLRMGTKMTKYYEKKMRS